MSMTLIQTATVGAGGVTSITFGSIATTWDDLLVIYSLRGTGAGANSPSISAGVLINGSGGSTRRILGNGSSASSAAFTTGDLYPGEFSGATSTANTFGNSSIYIPNYKSSVAKSISFDAISENSATEAYQVILAGLSFSADPVTSITLRVYGASANISFAEHSSASLYGITRGSSNGVVVS